MQKRKKKSSVTVQIARPMSIFMVILIILGHMAMYVYSALSIMSEKESQSAQMADFTAHMLSDYESIGWLASYYYENYNEIDKFYDYRMPEMINIENDLNLKIENYMEACEVTVEQLKRVPDYVQKEFAEYCYAEITDQLSSIKTAYQPSFLDAFVIKNNECFFIFSGCDFDDGEKHVSEGGTIFELGMTTPYTEGTYKVLDKILTSEKPDNALELSLSDKADRSNVRSFAPVYDKQGNLVLIIAVSHLWEDILKELSDAALKLTLIMLSFFGLLIIWLIHGMTKTIVRPLKMEESILKKYIIEKDTEATVARLKEIQSNNELETLAENFALMTLELKKYIDEVREAAIEKERIHAELELASNIQLSALPSTFPAFPERTEFDIYATMNPAKEVGGDFYDFFLIDDDHLALVIADVSGKGVPAALFMMSSKMLISNYASISEDPAVILDAVNSHIFDQNKDRMFVTVWLGILEISTGKMSCTNAGHEYPAIKRANGKFEMIRDKHGLVVGVKKNVTYKRYELQLQKGDILFVYTDGVPEAMNAEEVLFGEDRTIEALNSASDEGLDVLLRTVKNVVDEFVGDAPQFDDLTMLALKYSGKD